MLVEPVKDLLDAFVIGAVNRLVTVATVENQHFEPGGTVVGESAGVGSGDRLMWFLNRRAWHITIRTKHAAIPLFGFHYFVARLAVVGKLAVIQWHDYLFRMATVWTF
jgi:hypothetical protein